MMQSPAAPTAPAPSTSVVVKEPGRDVEVELEGDSTLNTSGIFMGFLS